MMGGFVSGFWRLVEWWRVVVGGGGVVGGVGECCLWCDVGDGGRVVGGGLLSH